MSTGGDRIYKIFRTFEWEAARKAGVFGGSDDDIRDGFIHFSTAEHLRETVAKHFANEDEIVLAAVDPAALGKALRWEASRGGVKFPHLYAPLPLSAVRKIVRLSRDTEKGYIFPDDIP